MCPCSMEFEAVVAALRPKSPSPAPVSKDFCLASYEILLIDTKIAPTKVVQQLPKKLFSIEEEAGDVLLNFLYQLTGAEHGGLRAKRAVFVPQSIESVVGSSLSGTVGGALYCLPLDDQDSLPSVSRLEGRPKFVVLDQAVEGLNHGLIQLTEQTRHMLRRLERWLSERGCIPGALDLLFSSSAEERLRRSVTNPAYFLDLGVDDTSQTSASEALAKMMEIEKSDMFIRNPLYDSQLTYIDMVNKLVVNQFFGQPTGSLVSHVPSGEERRRGSRTWAETFPLHKAATEGSSTTLVRLLSEGCKVDQRDDDSWTPLHYAAWSGELSAMTVLLSSSHPVNSSNVNGRTPLHVAAANGRSYAVELLLAQPDIDVGAIDKYGKTALELCEHVDKPDWQEAARLLDTRIHTPVPTLNVFLMDGSYRVVKLVHAANTTVQHLSQQMMKELQLPTSCDHLFTLWICSRNLQLQLKPDHKPTEHLNDWKRKIVTKLSDHSPDREDPQLFWRRDAINAVEQDKKVTHPMAVQLLFNEAYHNYITSLYPCVEQDVLILASIFLHLSLGPYSTQTCKDFFSSESRLKSVVPNAMLRSRSRNWVKEICAQYKFYSQTVSDTGATAQSHHQNFLAVCWNLTVYGSAFFTGQIRAQKRLSVYVGVNDVGIHLINGTTKEMLQCFKYSSIAWQEKSNVLELKPTGPALVSRPISVHTKQAGLVVNLMNKLSSLSSSP